MRRPLGIATTILAISVAVAGCETNFENTAPRATNIKIAETVSETRVLLADNCPVTEATQPKAAPAAIGGLLIGALAPLASDLLLSSIGNYLKARQDAVRGQHIGLGGGTIFTGGKAPSLKAKCIIVARGDFGPRLLPSVGTGTRGGLNSDALRKAGLADFPDLYIEIAVGAKLDGQPRHLFLAPQFLHFARTIAGRTIGGSKNINLLLILARTPIDPAKIDKDFAVAAIPIKFEKVEIGTERRVELFGGRTIIVPISGPAMPPKEKPPGQNPPKATAGATPQPNDKPSNLDDLTVNIAAVVEETEKPSDFDELLVSTFNGQKKDLSKALVDFIKGLFAEEKK